MRIFLKEVAGIAVLLLFFVVVIPAQGDEVGNPAAQAPVSAAYFEDTFDGAVLNSNKWNTDNAVGALRWCSTTVWNHHGNPGNWQDVSLVPCNGYTQSYPYGYVTVENGTATFSSDYKRTFPYIWTGLPGRPSPFPASGDFVLELKMKYNAIRGDGDGFQALNWSNTDPIGNNPPAGQGGAFALWADNSGVNTNFGNVASIYMPEALAYHVYRLEYIGGKYSYYLDGVLKYGPVANSLRPNAIWIGNPVFTDWTLTDWSDFTLDYVRVTVPNRPPVAQAGPDQTIECGGPGGTAVTLNGSGSSDPDGDTLSYAWSWNGGTATGVNPFVNLPLGKNTITLTVDDGKGGTATDTVIVTVRDTVPPVSSVRGIAGVSGDNGWYRSDVLIVVDSADACSGVKEIRYSVDGAAAIAPGNTATIAVNGDGIHGVTFGAADNAGNVEQAKMQTINIDRTQPTIAATITPASTVGGWHSADVTVTFTCADELSGVASCPAPVTVNTDGAGQIVTVRAVDRAGNTATTSVTLNIDKTAPIISASISPSQNGKGWFDTDVTVTFTCSDTLSGVASCPAPVTVKSDGAGQIVTGVAVDKAGNTATTSVTLNIDKTAPIITASISPSPNGNGWYNTDVTVTFTCSDALSGVASCPAPVTVTAEGAGQLVTGTAVDKAGNTASTSVTVNIDKTAPTAGISVTPGILWPPNHKMVNMTVNGGAADPTSSVASVVITVIDEYGAVQPVVNGFNTSIPLEAWREGDDMDGRHYTITAVITDKAGNKTTVSTEAVCPHDMRDKK